MMEQTDLAVINCGLLRVGTTQDENMITAA